MQALGTNKCQPRQLIAPKTITFPLPRFAAVCALNWSWGGWGSGMFGAILSGRFPATNCVQVDENRFVLVLEASNVPQGGPNDHLTIFLFEPSLPDDYGATIHWHKTQGSDEWVYLGYLNNLKPSSHFRASASHCQASPMSTQTPVLSSASQLSTWLLWRRHTPASCSRRFTPAASRRSTTLLSSPPRS